MTDKSYVTLATCPICRKETGKLLLDRRLRPKFEMHTQTPEPCDSCRKKYLSKGVMLYNPETGSLAVIKTTAFKKLFNQAIPTGHIAFAEEEVFDHIIPKKPNELNN